VFHEDTYFCRGAHKNCTVASGMTIRRGHVISGKKDGAFVELNRVEFIVNPQTQKVSRYENKGFLSNSRFEELLATGVVTDASQKFPRMIHKSSRIIRSMSTDCGITRSVIDTRKLKSELSSTLTPTGLIPFLKDLFQISASVSASNEQTETLETKLGGPGYATEYRQLIIQEPDDAGNFSIEKSAYVSSNIKCAQVGMNSQPIYITSLSIRYRNSFYWLNFSNFCKGNSKELEPNSPEVKIFQKNGNRPYFTSINSFKDYENSMKTWAAQVGDVSLAAIFLMEFNGSCPRGKVRGHSIEDFCHDALNIRDQ
jgi:hypothetical protein